MLEMQTQPKQLSHLRIGLAIVYLAARYYAAFVLLTYGFYKLMGAQFTVLDSQLAKPMGEVSGFWLTWYYFGYSGTYSNIVAITQIIAAVLLCFRRTSLIGALAILPVMVNIVSINVWVIGWRLNSDALRNAIYVLAAVVLVICFHAKAIFTFVSQTRNQFAIFSRPSYWALLLQLAVVAAMVGYKAHEGYWVANINNRTPTPIDGAWHVTDMQPAVQNAPDWIYFEYNRAHMVVFRFPDGQTDTHDFRVDPSQRSLAIGQLWLTSGSDIFKGQWDRNGDILRIKGTWGNSLPIDLTLRRKEMPLKDHQ